MRQKKSFFWMFNPLNILKIFGMIWLMFMVCTSYAQRIKVTQTCANPLDCPLTLAEGFKTTLQFSLDQPIVCDVNISRECAVTVLLTNQDPKIVAIDPCLVKWTSADWFQKRTVKFQAVETYKNDPTPRSVTIKTEPAISPSLFYDGFKPYDIMAKTQNRASAQCRATGDPHYTTFDGAYWHFYDGNTRPRTLVHLVKSTNPNRPFGELQVQNQMRGYPAVNCALAGREGNNLFILDACSGRLVITSRFGSEIAQQPKVEVTGSTYTVYFKSGFWMRGVVYGSYIDLYVQTPGIDFNSVCGICGNFDGNPNNDYNVYMSTMYSQLTACQQVQASEDLWNWQPSSISPEPVLPIGAEKCNYTEPTYIKPIINNAPGEDITDELRKIYSDSLDNRTQYVIVPPEPVIVPDAGITFDLAKASCQRDITGSAAIQTCLQVFGPTFYNITTRVKECAEDVVETQSYASSSGAIVGMTVECADYAVEKDMDNDPRLLNVLCMNACNGNGLCFNARCMCDAGYGNPDCSYIDGKPPRITALYDTICEVSGAGSCPRELAVTGKNFYKSNRLRCRYGSTIVNAIWLGGDSVVCAVPMEVYKDAEYETINLQVTNDYTNEAEWSNVVPFIFYNGACWSCNASSRACGPNPNSCRINDVCYHRDHVNAPDNACQVCDPTKSATAWTYSYTNQLLCSPFFEQRTYDYTIYCEALKDTQLITVRASNSRAANDPNYRITYSIKHNVDHPEVEEFYKINNITGVISALVDINHEKLSGGMNYNIGNPLTYNGFFMVRAVDNYGNFAESNVVIELRGTAADGTCNAPKPVTFNVTIAENATINTPLVKIVEPDLNARTYSWWFEDGANGKFGINETTGDVWVAKSLDYEEQNIYRMQVRATDQYGLWYLINYVINILDVNEPPSILTLSSLSVVEHKVGAVVGSLYAKDPENSNVTFSISKNDNYFTIDNSTNPPKLVTKNALNADGPSGLKSVNVTITASDPQGLSFTKTFNITVINVNDPPGDIRLVQLENLNPVTDFPESLLAGETIARVIATDPENDDYQCGVVSDSTFEVFYDGQYNFLRLINSVNYEKDKTVGLAIRCADIPKDGSPSAISQTQQFVLNVLDVNEGPSYLNLLLKYTPVENVKPVTPLSVGTLVAKDYDINTNVSMQFSITSPKGLFQIGNDKICVLTNQSGLSCNVSLMQVEALDYESTTPAGSQNVVIRIEDVFGAWNEFTVIVPIINVNEAPNGIIFTPNPQPFVIENSPINTVITTILANDPDIDDFHTFELINNGDGAFKLDSQRFGRRDTSVNLLVANSSKFDFETNPSMSFTIKVTDSGNLSVVVTKTIEVRDRPMVITSNSTSIRENTIIRNQRIALLTLENYDIPDSLSWFFAADDLDNQDNNNDMFIIRSIAGSIPPQAELYLGKSVDFESVKSLTVSVGVSFSGGRMPVNTRLIFNITDVNEYPIFSASSFVSIPITSNTPIGTVILSAPARDPENSSITYTLSTQLPYIRVSGNGNLVLISPVPLTYSTTTEITLTATDATGLSTSVPVTIKLASACEINPCNNRGICKLCKINGLVSNVPAQVCDNLPLNQIKGYICSCDKGFSGLNCDYKQETYTIVVVLVPKTPIPLTATLSTVQELAIKDKYIQRAELQGSVSRNDLNVKLYPNNNGVMVLTFTRQSTSGPSDKEKNMGVFEFEYTLPDLSNPTKTTTVSTEGTANPTVVQTNTVSSTSTQNTPENNNKISNGVVAGVAIGIVLLLILVLFVLLLVRKQHSRIDFDKDTDIYGSHAVNPLFIAPKSTSNNNIQVDNPTTGFSNEMYDWYQPTMSRKECTQYLMLQGEGAFIIRDSASTPGWHMLGVKTSNEVIHEKIRYTEDFQYEMIPSKSNIKQPKFKDLAALVEFYLKPQADIPYTLAVSNPIYDNHNLKQNDAYKIIECDTDAPALPIKDKHLDNITNLANFDVTDDIYTNTEEAKQVLIERADYHYASSLNIEANINNNNEYLITGNDCDINNSYYIDAKNNYIDVKSNYITTK